jgi:hypothetical protein
MTRPPEGPLEIAAGRDLLALIIQRFHHLGGRPHGAHDVGDPRVILLKLRQQASTRALPDLSDPREGDPHRTLWSIELYRARRTGLVTDTTSLVGRQVGETTALARSL